MDEQAEIVCCKSSGCTGTSADDDWSHLYGMCFSCIVGDQNEESCDKSEENKFEATDNIGPSAETNKSGTYIGATEDDTDANVDIDANKLQRDNFDEQFTCDYPGCNSEYHGPCRDCKSYSANNVFCEFHIAHQTHDEFHRQTV